MISQHENELCIKFSIVKLLVVQRDANQLKDIQRLYEAANITNRQLVYQFKEKRFNHDRMLESVLSDIYDILAKRIYEDDNVRMIFEDIFFNRYPEAKQLADDVIQAKGIIRSSTIKRINGLKKIDCEVYTYRICTSGLLTEIEGKSVGIDTDYFLKGADIISKTSVDMFISGANSIHYTETDESIFESSAFKRFLNNRRNELAEYLKCKPENLGSHILEEIKNGCVGDAETYQLDGIPQIMLFISRIITNKQNSGPYWIDSMIAEKGKFMYLPAYNYKPDIDEIIRLFYMGLVIERVFEFEDRGENYNKISLARYSSSDSPESDLRSITLLCIIDIVFHMLVMEQEQEHVNFSWDKITGVSEIEHYRLKAEQVIDENIRLKENIVAITAENDRINAEIRKKTDNDNYSLINENKNLANTIYKKDLEIEELKRRLKLQDELISSLQVEEKDEEEQVDISLLKGMRFLFVGYSREALPELRKEFPNSVFMEHETDKLMGLDVDAVVMLTKLMSHSMYYKVKSSNNLISVPIIMSNSKNINRIYYDMYTQLK